MHKLAIDLVNGWKSQWADIYNALNDLYDFVEKSSTNVPADDRDLVLRTIDVWQGEIDSHISDLGARVDGIAAAQHVADALSLALAALNTPSIDDATGERTYWWAAVYDAVGSLFGWATPDQASGEALAINGLLDQAQEFRDSAIDQLTELKDISPDAAQVADAVRTVGDRVSSAISDAPSYPVLTQEIGFGAPTPFPAASPGTSSTTSNLGNIAAKAISDVLGWKARPDDPRAFLGALNASFTCTDVEGHTVCTWTPRSYAVATDLAGGITGAQASIYARAQEAVDKALPLLDGLYALDPTADQEDITALKNVARTQMTEMVAELGMMGGPRSTRVSQYFTLLLDTPFPLLPQVAIETDPDRIGGTLGTLRDVLGFAAVDDFVNSVDDEQDVTNFRILSDYMTSLAQSWVNNLAFFMTPPPLGIQPFFGTQLVLLSRQLSVVAESVSELRFAMDSVFIGPAERQTLAISLELGGSQPFSMYAEDLISWVETFASEEGPRLVQDGGKYAVGDSFARQAENLNRLVAAARTPANPDSLPPAYFTGRVQVALQELSSQLANLVSIASPVRHRIQQTAARQVSSVVTAIGNAPTFADLQKRILQRLPFDPANAVTANTINKGVAPLPKFRTVRRNS